MNITVNQKDIETENNIVKDLLIEMNLPTNGIAIAINDEVISKSEWDNFKIKENDKILIITATQGG